MTTAAARQQSQQALANLGRQHLRLTRRRRRALDRLVCAASSSVSGAGLGGGARFVRAEKVGRQRLGVVVAGGALPASFVARFQFPAANERAGAHVVASSAARLRRGVCDSTWRHRARVCIVVQAASRHAQVQVKMIDVARREPCLRPFRWRHRGQTHSARLDFERLQVGRRAGAAALTPPHHRSQTSSREQRRQDCSSSRAQERAARISRRQTATCRRSVLSSLVLLLLLSLRLLFWSVVSPALRCMTHGGSRRTHVASQLAQQAASPAWRAPAAHRKHPAARSARDQARKWVRQRLESAAPAKGLSERRRRQTASCGAGLAAGWQPPCGAFSGAENNALCMLQLGGARASSLTPAGRGGGGRRSQSGARFQLRLRSALAGARRALGRAGLLAPTAGALDGLAGGGGQKGSSRRKGVLLPVRSPART
jgi:hypothetical protein